MSLPEEKARAVKYTREWLFKLLDRKYQPKITEIRTMAARLLRHFPYECEIDSWIESEEKKFNEQFKRTLKK